MTQCCLVSPEWVDIGWVHWAGTPVREKLFNIRYRRCEAQAAEPVARDGLVFEWCASHRAERVPSEAPPAAEGTKR